MENQKVKKTVKQKLFHEINEYLINFAWLGMAQLIFFIFIPFFAYKELLRLMGKEKMRELFLKRHSAQKEYK
jgi:hypothetical protein